MKRKFTYASPVLIILLLSLLSGCTTTSRNTLFREVDQAYESGNYATAQSYIESNKVKLYREKDTVLYHLETGMLDFYSNEFSESNRHLDQAELLIEEYFTKSISQAASSLLINDLQLDYRGEDFEDIYLNIFKALNFLSLNDTGAAFVEVRRISNKLNLLEDKYAKLALAYTQSDKNQGVQIKAGSSRFYNSALARYISLLMYRSEGDYDGVRIDWQLLLDAFNLQPNLYPFPIPFDSTISVQPQNKQDTRLSLIAFTGRSPIKFASTLRINTFENHVVISTVSENGTVGRELENLHVFEFPGVKEGYWFKFEIPRMEKQGSSAERIRVIADGYPLGFLGLLENMEQITLDTFEIREPIIFLRTAIRTIIKGMASEAIGSTLENSGAKSGSDFLKLLGFFSKYTLAITSEISEQADLRVSRYFPAFAHAGEWQLPPGDYHIEVEYYDHDKLLFTDDLGTVSLVKNQPNLLTSTYSR
jgi:uncharacterized protein